MEDVPSKDTGDDQALTRACTPHATLIYPRVNITVSTSVPSILCFHYITPPWAEKKPGLAQITLLKSFWILYQELPAHNSIELINELQQKTLLDVIL